MERQNEGREQEIRSNRREQEIREAVEAGERALSSLREAREQLNSARNWGIWDLLGGGFFTDLVKHSKLENAARCIENAKRDLQLFEKELRDVTVKGNLNIDIGNFLLFADFFFDGLIAGYMMQSKIAEAKQQVEEACERTELLLIQLRTMD